MMNSANWKIYCYKRVKKIGYKGKEIINLMFQIKEEKLIGIIDRHNGLLYKLVNREYNFFQMYFMSKNK